MVSQIFVQESKKAFYQTKTLSNQKKMHVFNGRGNIRNYIPIEQSDIHVFHVKTTEDFDKQARE